MTDAPAQAACQSVEEFDEIISSESAPAIVDGGGAIQAFSAELYCKVGKQRSLFWFAAECLGEGKTIFSFSGTSSNRPYGLAQGSEATVVLNGELGDRVMWNDAAL